MNSLESIGIDLGSINLVIAVATKASAEIVTNEASSRETHVIVGFGDHERFIGEQGYVQLKSNFKRTIVFPTRFLGLSANYPSLNEEKKWLYTPLVTEGDRLAFEVTIRGETQRFLPEQVAAMVLQKTKQICAKEGLGKNEVIISVPTYYTEPERNALVNAARIAQINLVRVINESAAIASDYGIFRRAEFASGSRNVCFVDFGHCSAGAFVVSFSAEKARIVSQVYERNLGTRNLDWKVLEFYCKMIKEKFGSDVIKKDKPRLRLLDAIEKQRKVLSANSEAGINVDCIVEEDDLNHLMTRDQFEEIIAPVIDEFRIMLVKLRSEVPVSIHSIEIIGGGTRIPIIQRAVQEIFNLDCSRTLNGSECISKGCAMQAAMASPFKATFYTVDELNYHTIKCAWKFAQDPQEQIMTLFDRNCPLPTGKDLTFPQDNSVDLNLFYGGSNQIFATYRINASNTGNTAFKIAVRVTLDMNGNVRVDKAQLVDENKKPIGAPLKIEYFSSYDLTPEQIHHLTQQEIHMTAQDRSVQEAYEKKNELESYVYDMRGKLNEKYSQYVTPAIKNNLLFELEKTENWLYGDGAKASHQDYKQKFYELKLHTEIVEVRCKEYETIPAYIEQFNKVLTNFQNVVTLKNSSKHISTAKRQAVLDAVKEQRTWLEKIETILKNPDRTINPPTTCQELQEMMQSFMDKYSPMIGK